MSDAPKDPKVRAAEVLIEYAAMIEDGEIHHSGPLEGKCDPEIQEEIDEYRALAAALAQSSTSAMWVWWEKGDGYAVGPRDKGAVAIVFTIEEAQALCAAFNTPSATGAASRKTGPLGMRVCEPSCHSAAACLHPDNCKANMQWENERGGANG